MLKESTAFSTISTPSSYPASQKRYLSGARANLRVPYREIALSATRHGERVEENLPLPVYDTSGPYTGLEAQIALHRGLPKLRTNWIKERGDADILSGPSSEYARMSDNNLLNYDVRFPSPFISRRACRGKNVSQIHYAREGIVTAEMEFVALRESMQLERLLQDPYYASLARQHRGQSWGARLPERNTKLHRLEENLGAVNVELTEDELPQIDEAASRLKLEGAHLPEAVLKMTGL